MTAAGFLKVLLWLEARCCLHHLLMLSPREAHCSGEAAHWSAYGQSPAFSFSGEVPKDGSICWSLVLYLFIKFILFIKLFLWSSSALFTEKSSVHHDASGSCSFLLHLMRIGRCNRERWALKFSCHIGHYRSLPASRIAPRSALGANAAHGPEV